MVGLFAVFLWVAWRGRGYLMVGPRLVTPPSAGRCMPTMMLAAPALALTLLAVLLSTPDMTPLLIVVQFTTIVLPTFLLYFGLFAALHLVVTRRSLASAFLLALALLPFAHWAYVHWSTAQEHQREANEIVAIDTVRATRLPATMVIEGNHVTATPAAWTIPGIDHVITGDYRSRLMRVDRPPPRGRRSEPRQITSLPDEYLLLRVGRSSSYAKDRQNYAAAGGPLELRLVDPQRNALIAVWYRAYNPSPSLVPVLTAMGWFRGSNSATTDEINAVVAAFLARALGTNT
jgi:hypothetical protein